MAVMKKLDEDIDPTSPSQDHTDRWPRDRRLRQHGFTILARPKQGPTLWMKGGKEFTEFEALQECNRIEQSA